MKLFRCCIAPGCGISVREIKKHITNQFIFVETIMAATSLEEKWRKLRSSDEGAARAYLPWFLLELSSRLRKVDVFFQKAVEQSHAQKPLSIKEAFARATSNVTPRTIRDLFGAVKRDLAGKVKNVFTHTFGDFSERPPYTESREWAFFIERKTLTAVNGEKRALYNLNNMGLEPIALIRASGIITSLVETRLGQLENLERQRSRLTEETYNARKRQLKHIARDCIIKELKKLGPKAFADLLLAWTQEVAKEVPGCLPANLRRGKHGDFVITRRIVVPSAAPQSTAVPAAASAIPAALTVLTAPNINDIRPNFMPKNAVRTGVPRLPTHIAANGNAAFRPRPAAPKNHARVHRHRM